MGRLLSWTADYLARQGVDEARLATEVLLAHAAGCARIDLYTRFEAVPDAEAVTRFRALVKRAAAHEPVAYLVGEKEFFSLTFTVTPDVLIPRPETETLVEYVIDHCRSTGKEDARLLDLGTGTGCIVIAVLAQLSQARAAATDVSEPALAVARKNAERHGVAERLTFACADRLDLPTEMIADRGFDVVMSNPPYVAADALRDLDANVREYEPHVALTDGADGLSFCRDIAAGGERILRPGGIVALEIAAGRGDAVRGIFESAGWLHRATRKDRVEGHDRVLAFAQDG
jgi:release factor glutamine methyltransferase